MGKQTIVGVTAEQLHALIKADAIGSILSNFDQDGPALVCIMTLGAIIGTTIGQSSKDREDVLGLMSAVQFIIHSTAINSLEPQQTPANEGNQASTQH